MQVSKFQELLNKKFLEWQQESGQRKTLKEFAEYLGFKPTTLSNWLNTDSTPEGFTLYQLSLRLGDEVYEVLGKEKIDYFYEQFSAVPHVLRDRVFSAFREIDNTLSEKTIDLSPEEAERLAESIMTRYGWTRTDKKKPGNDG